VGVVLTCRVPSSIHPATPPLRFTRIYAECTLDSPSVVHECTLDSPSVIHECTHDSSNVVHNITGSPEPFKQRLKPEQFQSHRRKNRRRRRRCRRHSAANCLYLLVPAPSALTRRTTAISIRRKGGVVRYATARHLHVNWQVLCACDSLMALGFFLFLSIMWRF